MWDQIMFKKGHLPQEIGVLYDSVFREVSLSFIVKNESVVLSSLLDE